MTAPLMALEQRKEAERFDCAPWVHKTRTLPREQLHREVEKE